MNNGIRKEQDTETASDPVKFYAFRPACLIPWNNALPKVETVTFTSDQSVKLNNTMFDKHFNRLVYVKLVCKTQQKNVWQTSEQSRLRRISL